MDDSLSFPYPLAQHEGNSNLGGYVQEDGAPKERLRYHLKRDKTSKLYLSETNFQATKTSKSRALSSAQLPFVVQRLYLRYGRLRILEPRKPSHELTRRAEVPCWGD